MWFFKKKQTQAAMPRLPSFPSSEPQSGEGLASYPGMLQQVKELPKIDMPKIEIPLVISPPPEIPKREPLVVQKRTYPERDAIAAGMTSQPHPIQPEQHLFEEHDTHGLPQRTPHGLAVHEEARPQTSPSPVIEPVKKEQQVIAERRPVPPDEKPVFVKLEQYREVIANIETLKQKIKETEYLLERIEELRSQEQVELDNCHGNINKLKEKLLSIDKKLFEV